jgi:hypothetical protein
MQPHSCPAAALAPSAPSPPSKPLLLQLQDVPGSALSDAAILASALLGRSCTESTWWHGAKGFMVLGEATARVKVHDNRMAGGGGARGGGGGQRCCESSSGITGSKATWYWGTGHSSSQGGGQVYSGTGRGRARCSEACFCLSQLLRPKTVAA